MQPTFKTGMFKIDASFSSSSGLTVDIGMKPGLLKLRAMDYAPSSAAGVIGIDVDFNTTKQLNYTLTNASTTNTLAAAFVTVASSASNAITVKDTNVVSKSSSSSVIVGVQVVPKLGFNIAKGLAAGVWKGKTIHYEAHANQRFKSHGTLGG